MSIILNDNLKINAGKPVDSKYLNGTVDYVSVAEVNGLIPISERHPGLTVRVNLIEYWYESSVDDIGLVAKGTGSLASVFVQDETTSSIKPVSGGTPVSTGSYSMVVGGKSNEASGDYSLASGYYTTATTIASHAEGYETLSSGFKASHAEGNGTLASGNFGSHSEGSGTVASGDYSHAEGGGTTASSRAAHAEGFGTLASGNQSHAEGLGTMATDQSTHAEGNQTSAVTLNSHSEGNATLAFGEDSHSEGSFTRALGNSSHAEGQQTSATTLASHAEGRSTLASGNYAHAEGTFSQAIGDSSHAEGKETISFGIYSHAGGLSSTVSGETSFIHSNNSTIEVGSNNSSILGGSNNRLLALATGSTILGGTGITGTTQDTVYGINFDASGSIYSGGTNLSDIFIASGSPNNLNNVTFKSASSTLLESEAGLVIVTGNNVILTLPNSPATGTEFKIKDGSGNGSTDTIIISGNTHGVDGFVSTTIEEDYGSLTFIFDGVNDYMIL